MPDAFHLQVGSLDGSSQSFALTEHDTFLLGRNPKDRFPDAGKLLAAIPK